MPQTDPNAVAARWANNLAGATSKIQAGIESVTTPPGQLAARQKAAYVQGVTANADKWGTNVAAVPLSDWQNAAVQKGLPRIATGASQAEPKFATFMTKLLPYINSGRGQLPPRGNLQQNIQRATAWINYMAQFKK